MMGCNSNKNQPPSIKIEEIRKDTFFVVKQNDTVTKEKLIIPGKEIGQINLLNTADVVYQLLGKPSNSDAAMGKALSIWKNGNHRTIIFFVTNFGDSIEASRVKQIVINSPYFETTDSVKVGSDFNFIKSRFPDISKIGEYKDYAKNSISIYDDIKTGIAFEINKSNTCVGICVHVPSEKAYQTYLAIYPEFTSIN